MNKLYSLCVALICLLWLSGSHAQVNININGKSYSYAQAPRLSQVLEPVHTQQHWYWPQSKLFDLNVSAVFQQKQKLVARLSDYSLQNKAHADAVSHVTAQIQQWPLAVRVMMDIDLDKGRLNLQHNPLISAGNYVMSLSVRSSSLSVFGLVQQPRNISYQNNTCIEDLLANIEVLPDADKSYVYVISPRGLVERLPIAYWNAACRKVRAGSMIFVPFAENQFAKQHSEINQLIAKLAINRTDIR